MAERALFYAQFHVTPALEADAARPRAVCALAGTVAAAVGGADRAAGAPRDLPPAGDVEGEGAEHGTRSTSSAPPAEASPAATSAVAGRPTDRRPAGPSAGWASRTLRRVLC
jgi:hypothetical protein